MAGEASRWADAASAAEAAIAPKINVFQQGSDLLAIIELPGIDKDSLQIQAQENTIRIAGILQRSGQDYARLSSFIP